MKLLIAALLILAGGISGGAHQPQFLYEDSVPRLLGNKVEGRRPEGAGFIVRKDIIVTADHVAQVAISGEIHGEMIEEVKKSCSVPVLDSAVMSGRTNAPPLPISPIPFALGERVILAGYPYRVYAEVPGVVAGYYQSVNVWVGPSSAQAFGPAWAIIPIVRQINLHGMSGGPAVTETGVKGIFFAFGGIEQTVAYVAPIMALQSVCRLDGPH